MALSMSFLGTPVINTRQIPGAGGRGCGWTLAASDFVPALAAMGSSAGLTFSAFGRKTAWTWEEADLYLLHGVQVNDDAFGAPRPP
eukprot:CAMPEP_0172729490 /NCGR_PEP_ID=MMETSP1074-20121228/95043_1 /TAXON_ID=2916 /ORGANISM="Ceratium fusus, Strain PA161109" /LENGTH=85 /DNA_ID=CAMNT_0013556989 /DNA_START=654 /DNA_END=909 /DNA_ORIENTATION=+